jgi:hypothetical protein
VSDYDDGSIGLVCALKEQERSSSVWFLTEQHLIISFLLRYPVAIFVFIGDGEASFECLKGLAAAVGQPENHRTSWWLEITVPKGQLPHPYISPCT